jgi:IS30 family transposase
MSKNYSHLSSEQRYQIEALLKSGTSKKEIAKIVGKHPSTITRELKRNTGSRGYGATLYRAKNAQRRTALRHKEKPKKKYFTQEMKVLSRGWLMNERLSPEFIHAEGQKQIKDFVSHETIYKWIWDCKHTHRKENQGDERLYKYLAHGRRRRKRGRRRECRGIIHNRVSIEQRPKIV